jgi:hypothetical protein
MGAPDPPATRPTITVEDLERWEDSGATWRALELTDERTVVELCTCSGEPVDALQSEAPEVIEFVRARPAHVRSHPAS